jgi:hypothetical protein
VHGAVLPLVDDSYIDKNVYRISLVLIAMSPNVFAKATPRLLFYCLALAVGELVYGYE